ncbi:MAG: glycosyltransferase family 39 protein [Spirochaetales bacterium]|nr:glycosyltransferase family 39 protein [Spirochaetales bacterium]
MPHNNQIRGLLTTAPFFSRRRGILLFCFIYFALNLLFFGRYPLVHSDESWLAGLTLEMMDLKSLAVTEPFFDLFPRYPHAIKVLFHFLQMPFISLGGFNHLSVRLLSLLAGGVSLLLFYRILAPSFGEKTAFLGTGLLALNIQFILASHTARQEVVILCLLLLVFYLGIDPGKKDSGAFRQGLVIALAIGIHPNAFLIFLPALCILLYRLVRREVKLKVLGLFFLPVCTGAAVFVLLSFFFDADFLRHYLTFGSSVGISADPFGRLRGFFVFYVKLFYSVTGTYTVPRQKVLWIFYGLILLGSVALLGVDKQKKHPLMVEGFLALVGLNLGLLLIGKYSQPSAVFLLPFLLLLFLSLVHRLRPSLKTLLPVAAALLFAVVSLVNIRPFLASDYLQYLGRIEAALPGEGAVLANLNAGFLFRDRDFRDYRNLAFLEEEGMSFADYIATNNITALVVPEELDFIYENRPRWNIVYGNIVPWYRQMLEFIEKRCVLLSEFSDPYYGMRINAYIAKKDWRVRVYRVLSPET